MAKLVYTNNINRWVYECEECHNKTRTYYSERHVKVICSDCRRKHEREAIKKRTAEKMVQNQIYILDELISTYREMLLEEQGQLLAEDSLLIRAADVIKSRLMKD